MSRRRRKTPKAPPPGPRAPHRRRVLLGLLLLVVGAGGAAFLLWMRQRPVEFPPPGSAAAGVAVTAADFVGAERCAACHQAQYDAWRGSTHGRAGGDPNEAPLVAPFDGTPIRFRDAAVTPTRNARGAHLFIIAQDGFPPVEFRVDGVIGGGHMRGGGTQGFVSRFPDGTVRFLPFDFARRDGVWFCNTNTRAERGWVPITRQLALADCGDWPPKRVLGSHPRFASCQQCHGSQIELTFQPGAGFATHWTSLAINCESCHGPGRRHVELAAGGRLEGTDVAIGVLSTVFDKDASLEACLGCHALKDELAPGYLPGSRLADHFSLELPHLGDRPYFPDGRVRTFAYQATHRYSDCYRNGSMTCVDCHEPHGQGYRSVTGAPLASPFDDGQCTGCHPSKAEPVERHTHHLPDSTGSRCVSCHMPYVQQPEVGTAVRYARSDHTIPVPRPGLDEALGVTSACAHCHEDVAIGRLAAGSAEWWGELKPRPAVVAAHLRADSVEALDRAAGLLLAPDARHPAAQAAGLARLIERHAAPDGRVLGADALEALERLSADRDLGVRALALALLHLDRGDDRGARRLLARRLAQAGADGRALRRRWAVALGFVGDQLRAAADPAGASLAYRKALEVLPDDPALLASFATARRDAGDLVAAIDLYGRSLAADPNRSLTWVNLGLAHQRSGDAAAAEDAYRRAIAVNPGELLAHFNLGNAHWRRGELPEALAAYERAAALDPSLVPAQVQLARAYLAAGRAADARRAARRAVEFDPADRAARALLEDLEQRPRR